MFQVGLLVRLWREYVLTTAHLFDLDIKQFSVSCDVKFSKDIFPYVDINIALDKDQTITNDIPICFDTMADEPNPSINIYEQLNSDQPLMWNHHLDFHSD